MKHVYEKIHDGKIRLTVTAEADETIRYREQCLVEPRKSDGYSELLPGKSVSIDLDNLNLQCLEVQVPGQSAKYLPPREDTSIEVSLSRKDGKIVLKRIIKKEESGDTRTSIHSSHIYRDVNGVKVYLGTEKLSDVDVEWYMDGRPAEFHAETYCADFVKIRIM